MMCPTEKLGLLEIVREDEFGPVKNANGAKEDTPDTAKMLLANRDKHWLEKLGLKFKEENSLKAWVEISPKLTYFGENLDQYISHYRNRELTLPFKLKHP
jgi:UDP-N-acetylglucosamine/UDP-N-acetylgalactosamine diphosphorylase